MSKGTIFQGNVIIPTTILKTVTKCIYNKNNYSHIKMCVLYLTASLTIIIYTIEINS